MRLLFTALTALAFPILGHAAIAGDWAGVLNLPQSTLRFVMHVSGPDNALRATVDSPDQGMAGGGVDSIVLSGATLSFAIEHLDVKFSGDVNTNGTIVGTFVQHGTGVPLVLTRSTSPTPAPPVPARISNRPPLPVTGGVFHHDRSGIDLTLPDGWSVRGLETATGDPGEMAVLAKAGHKAMWASVWMFRTETHPADMPKLFDAALARKLASRAGKNPLPDEAVIGNYTIRPGTLEHTVVNGNQALRAIGEFKDPAGELNTELLVWIYTQHARAYFDFRAQAAQFETLQPAFEQLIQDAKIP
jgi:hypothetical protein